MTQEQFLSGQPFRSIRDKDDAPYWEVRSVIEPQRRVVQLVDDNRKGMYITDIIHDGYIQVVPFLTNEIKWLYLPDLITKQTNPTGE